MQLRWVGYALAVAGVAAITALTLSPQTEPIERASIVCIWCDQLSLLDVLLNVALFAPLGAGLAMAGHRAATALLIALVVSGIAEGLQIALVSGRDPSVRDLLCNVIGGAAGFAIGLRWSSVLSPTRRLAWRLAGGARLGWVALHLVAGALMTPSLPEHPTWVIVGTHVGGFADFQGRVLGSSLRTRPSRVSQGGAPRNRPLAATTILMHPGPRRTALTPVLTIVERVGVFPLLIGVEGDDLHVRLRTRAADARLRYHAVRLPRAIRPWYRNGVQAADALLVRVTRTSDRLDATVEARSGGIVKVSMPVRTTQWWTLLSPSFATIQPGADYRSIAWCLSLLIPLGYWTSALHPARRRLGWSLGITAVISGLVLGPLVFSLSLPGWEEVIASGSGLALGGLLWRTGLLLAAPRASP